MSDIVERLRAPAYWMSGSNEGHEGENNAPREAADTITALRAENERLKSTIVAQETLIRSHEAEAERLREALQNDSTPEQVDDACMSFRHDYGLMKKVDQAALQWNATEWLRAWQKAFARTALEEKPQPTPPPWPKGFFKIERSIMDRCTSEGCGQVPSMRLEVGGIGSVYCEPCARKIAALEEKP